jgi:DNA-binding MarR family transcriptional regulator
MIMDTLLLRDGARNATTTRASQMPDTARRPEPTDVEADGFVTEHFLPYQFSVIANRVSDTLYRMYSLRFGLSVAGWRIIAILGARSPLSSRELSALLAMDPVAISRAVDQLVVAKLVSRRTDPKDRRRHQLRLTTEGRAVYDEIVPLARGIERAILEPLAPKDRQALLRIMGKLTDRSADILSEERDWREFLA